MFSLKDKERIIEEFRNNVNKRVENLQGENLSEYMRTGGVNTTRTCVQKIQSIMIASVPDGVPVPKLSLYISPICGSVDSEEITSVSLSVTNKLSDPVKYKMSVSVMQSDATNGTVSFFKELYETLIINELAKVNLSVLNKELELACAEANLEYNVVVMPPISRKNGHVCYMSNEEVQFVADIERVFKLEDIAIMHEPDEIFDEEIIKAAKEQLVFSLAESQTPEQLVKDCGGVLIQFVCNISRRTRAATTVKKVCSKNVFHLRSKKRTIAYYNEGNIFALVVAENGAYDVLLSPFDLETFRRVDMDVVAEILKQQ